MDRQVKRLKKLFSKLLLTGLLVESQLKGLTMFQGLLIPQPRSRAPCNHHWMPMVMPQGLGQALVRMNLMLRNKIIGSQVSLAHRKKN